MIARNELERLTDKLAALAEFYYVCEYEEIQIKGNASAIDEETDKEIEREIKSELESGNPWAWCHIIVFAEYEGFKGSDSLGCCSYKSERDFVNVGYEEMKQQALEDLASEIYRANTVLSELLLETR